METSFQAGLSAASMRKSPARMRRMMACAELGSSEADPGWWWWDLLPPLREEEDRPLPFDGARKGEHPESITY